MKKFLLAVLLGMAAPLPAAAADYNGAITSPSDPFIDEVRLGAFLHDLVSPEKDDGPDLNAEILFAKPWGTPEEWWLPRPHIGTTINSHGGTSTIYAGATWQYNVTSWAFIEASFGGSLNNGRDDGSYDRNAVGCAALFRESASIGFDITDHWRLMGTVEHNSNAGLCSHNRGLTNYGIRVGYKF